MARLRGLTSSLGVGPSTVPPIQRSTLQGQVRDAVEELIVFGGLAPGERLTEEGLASRLGVSRQPVREALHALSTLGFVDVSPGRGANVHTPTMREIREVFHVRAILEADGCALAARTIDDRGIQTLLDVCARGDAAMKMSDNRRLIELNSEFHRDIMRISGNDVAFELLDQLQRRIAWYLTGIIADRSPASWTEHREIVAALADSDSELAHDQMLRHIHHSIESFRLLDSDQKPDRPSAE